MATSTFMGVVLGRYGRDALFRQLSQMQHQLPNLFVTELAMRGHRGAGRSEANDPEQLPVRDAIDGFCTGKIARRRIVLARKRAFAIAFATVADGAEFLVGTAEESLFAGSQILGRSR